MTDRELLEAAAKAAGIDVWSGSGWQSDTLFRRPAKPDATGVVSGVEWNPLADDGDAFRLAVALQFTVRCYAGSTVAQTTVPAGPAVYIEETNHTDPAAATRRAIVRAAASMVPA